MEVGDRGDVRRHVVADLVDGQQAHRECVVRAIAAPLPALRGRGKQRARSSKKSS